MDFPVCRRKRCGQCDLDPRVRELEQTIEAQTRDDEHLIRWIDHAPGRFHAVTRNRSLEHLGVNAHPPEHSTMDEQNERAPKRSCSSAKCTDTQASLPSATGILL